MKTAKDKKRHYTMKAIAHKQTNCQDRVAIAKKALIFATMDETSDYGRYMVSVPTIND